MKRVKVTDLRNHLSRYLQRVRAGTRLLVLDRNRPIAEIRPVAAPVARKAGDDEKRLAALERKGILRRGKGPVPDALIDALRTAPPLTTGAGLLEALLEERRESR